MTSTGAADTTSGYWCRFVLMSLMIDVYLRGAPVAPPEVRPTLKLLYPQKGWKGWKWQVAAVLAMLLIPRVPQVSPRPSPPPPPPRPPPPPPRRGCGRLCVGTINDGCAAGASHRTSLGVGGFERPLAVPSKHMFAQRTRTELFSQFH